MSVGPNSNAGRSRAFSLVEVLIAIVVLALGLLGIAAVFPAVVSQQRSTTDAVQGIALSKSVETLLKSHYGANMQSRVPTQQTDPLFGQGVVDSRALRGWASLTGIPEWSEGQQAIGDCGLWDVATPGARPPGILLNATSGMVIVMGTANNPRPQSGEYRTPGFLMDEEGRLIGNRTAAGPNGPLLRGEYIFDFAARRIGAGREYLENGTTVQKALTCQDDQVELAVFIRRVDRPGTLPGNGVAVGEDAQQRPTFNGTGTYSPIRRGVFTIAADQLDFASSNEQLVTLDTNIPANLRRYMRQLGQKFVTPWGSVHVVTAYGDNPDDVVIKPILDPDRVSRYTGVMGNLEFLYTLQVPVAVDVVRISPKIVK